MDTNKNYHIDVTPEEDQLFRDVVPTKKTNWKVKFNLPQSFKFSKTVGIIATVHVFAVAVIFLTSTNTKAEDKKFLQETYEKQPSTPTKTDSNEVKKPEPQQTTTPARKDVHTKSNEFVKEYTVKQGDTIYSIAKKYKLNTERLIKINDIKDVNKISVGQKLKFM